MAIVPNIIGMVRDINDRRREARVEDAIRNNYLTSPDVAIQEAIKADPKRGLALQDRETERNAAAAAAARKRATDNTDFMARYLRGAPQGSDYGAILDQQADFLRQQGIKDEEIGAFKSAIAANPSILAGLDEESYKAMAKDRFSDTVATPGAYVRRGGETVERVPYAPKAVVVKGGDGSSEMRLFNPNDYLPGSVSGGGSNAVPRAEDGAAAPAGNPADLEEQAVNITGRVIMGNRNNPKGVQSVTQSEARLMQNAFGGGAAGKERFDGWAKQYGVRVVPDGQGATGSLPIERVQPAPAMRAQPQSGQRIGEPTAPKPKKATRPATPQELRDAGYPQGTAAQIDENGRFVNLKTPPAAALPKPKTPAQEYKELKDQEAFVTRNREAVETFGRLERTARELLTHPGLEGATGNVEGRLPQLLLGQSSVDFQNELEALKSQIGLSQLMKFKAQSSQGASGFGNLSNEEGRRLERAWGTLETTNSANVFRKNLNEIIRISQDVQKRSQQAAQKGYQPGATAAPQLGTRIKDRATGRTAILDNSGWVWEDTGRPVGGKKK